MREGVGVLSAGCCEGWERQGGEEEGGGGAFGQVGVEGGEGLCW